MSAHESVHKTPARHRLQVDQNQIPWRYEHPYQPSILIWYWEYYGGLVERLLRFLVDVIWHLHLQQNRPKIDALDIAADTSAGSQFRDLPSTLTFSTSKTDLDHSFTMRWSLIVLWHAGPPWWLWCCCDGLKCFWKSWRWNILPDREGKNQGKN